ncbi:ThuA domain-containing protein [Fodinibius sediminis]|uniref:Glucose/arabinose dehydrogenase, beta-propeller fold n=1 Tax=Fodinibius sediminis TaxID=1214077 RepID=A0A521AB37_9BACT|nr:ThuA domain-containing protein [Fodinibius sediminis]SMO32008.1 Glucose/arabinose dehydrogenase, beta-propeller fold [Fodinibius sediminis]
MKHSRTLLQYSIVFLFSFLILSCSKRSGPPRVLVFSKTAGFYHNSIPDGMAAIQKLGDENGFEVDTTTNAAMFTEDTLRQYSAVIFLSTTGNVLDKYQEADFERYIQAGGGYVGIHAAADTEYEWGWYGRMVGGYFSDHPGINDPHPNVQPGALQIEDSTHASTSFLPNPWERTDEWYSYKEFNEEVNVLLTIDEESYQGGADMGYHPMAWYHDYDGGRAFYTGLGHTRESFTEDRYLEHVLAGIQYAIGENRKLDYDKATTHRVPEANRFSKTQLVSGQLFEPTEMTILPNNDVLIAQRRGEVMLYKNSDSTLSQVGQLDVYWKTEVPNVNAEEGLMGIKADPDYEENHHIYLFYSPADTSVNRLSRFTFENDKLQLETETKILEFYSQRDICCHTGGSIAFDSEGLLYLSTGDNSTPFDEPDQKYVSHGYAPLDDRPGHKQYDAMRTSGNANDLRGKILRIRVNDDGSYDIPEGNLYPKGKEGTRPEIYVQGNRNPYRISVDQKNGNLYWGEVGPDASNDSLDTRGPKGYDEVNQAREAGFYGWPMFVGDNYAYHRYDYGTGESGKAFDPERPVNDSRNNTGIAELPPAQPAFIWYPYDESEEFPQVGTGGRNAMAGPVYYTDMYPEKHRLPDYFDGKLIIYDWIRGWIKVVTMKPNGDFDKMDSFMKGTEFNAPIDMEVGPEGRIYILEYGSGWFAQNDDSGLLRIDYNGGNRSPVVENISVDKRSGTLPLEITAEVRATDPEQDELQYRWNIGDGTTKETSEPRLVHTFEEIGEYSISVDVSDGHGHTVTSSTASVYAGNAAPNVSIEIEGNSTFYFSDQPVSYSVEVDDPDDPSAGDDLSTLFVSADYVEGGDDMETSMGHQQASAAMSGRSLLGSFDCQACHAVNTESIGPSYTSVSERYQDSSGVESYLVDKIINGGSGAWGDRAMPAHLEMSESDAQKIVSWIMSLSGEGQTPESLPATGQLDPTMGEDPIPNGVFVLSASYTDKGGENTKPLTGNASIYLRNNTVSFSAARNMDGYSTMTYEDNLLMMVPQEQGAFSLSNIDLTNISGVQFMTATQKPMEEEYVFELRLDSPDGEKVGEVIRSGGGKPTEQGFVAGSFTIPVEADVNEVHDIYIVSRPVDSEVSGQLILSGITFLNGQ